MPQITRTSRTDRRIPLRRAVTVLAASVAATGLSLVRPAPRWRPRLHRERRCAREHGHGPQDPVPGVTITNQTGGSVALAQSIGAGRTPDVFGSADADVNKFLLPEPAQRNEGALVRRLRAQRDRDAVQPERRPTRTRAAFAQAAAGQIPWYQPLITGPPINPCRMSPDADPSGYYTLFVMQLASRSPTDLPTLEAAGARRRSQHGTDRRRPAPHGKTLANGAPRCELHVSERAQSAEPTHAVHRAPRIR